MPKPSLLPFIPKRLAAWLRGPVAPKARRNVRVRSTTPRKLPITGAPYAPVPREKFRLKVRTRLEDRELGEFAFRWDEFVSRKDRRDAKRGDTGQHPKNTGTVRKHTQHTHPRDADGRAVTFVGQEPRRVWLGGISAQRGF